MEIIVVNNVKCKQITKYKQAFFIVADKFVTQLSLKQLLVATVVLVDDQEIKTLNFKYRKINQATDVLSFAYQDSPESFESSKEIQEYLGDIFISMETAKKQALAFGHSLKQEVVFLFTHGLLHLLGYDHQDDKTEKLMQEMEKIGLNELGYKI